MLGDKNLLAKLAGGDMIAIDAVYHCSCLTQLYRRAETVGCDVSDTSEVQVIKAHVFNELLDFIEENRGCGETLTMSNLTALYDRRIASLAGLSINHMQHYPSSRRYTAFYT